VTRGSTNRQVFGGKKRERPGRGGLSKGGRGKGNIRGSKYNVSHTNKKKRGGKKKRPGSHQKNVKKAGGGNVFPLKSKWGKEKKTDRGREGGPARGNRKKTPTPRLHKTVVTRLERGKLPRVGGGAKGYLVECPVRDL